jgi:ribosome-binding protein aMBF1 (putative translation factor)
VGITTDRQERNFAGHLYHGAGTTGGDPAGLHQEDAEDAAEGIGNRPAKGKGGQMTKISKLHDKWMKGPAYREAYVGMEDECALAAALMAARAQADLTQEEVARRMNTTQATVARLESGRGKPSTRTLERYAEATGTRLKISFEQVPHQAG